MTRNVINIEEIERMVDEVRSHAGDARIAYWLRTTWRKWLIRDCPSAYAVALADEGTGAGPSVAARDPQTGEAWTYDLPVPTWAVPALRRGTVLHHVEITPLMRAEVRDVVTWLASRTGAAWLSRLGRLDYPTAARKSEAWHMHWLEQVTNDAFGIAHTEMIHPFDDGFSIVRLRTREALVKEAREMQNCLAERVDSLDDGCVFLSLRDRRGKPHCTMELYDGVIVELAGKQNDVLACKYRSYVATFVKAMDVRIAPDLISAAWLRGADEEPARRQAPPCRPPPEDVEETVGFDWLRAVSLLIGMPTFLLLEMTAPPRHNPGFVTTTMALQGPVAGAAVRAPDETRDVGRNEARAPGGSPIEDAAAGPRSDSHAF